MGDKPKLPVIFPQLLWGIKKPSDLSLVTNKRCLKIGHWNIIPAINPAVIQSCSFGWIYEILVNFLVSHACSVPCAYENYVLEYLRKPESRVIHSQGPNWSGIHYNFRLSAMLENSKAWSAQYLDLTPGITSTSKCFSYLRELARVKDQSIMGTRIPLSFVCHFWFLCNNGKD